MRRNTMRPTSLATASVALLALTLLAEAALPGPAEAAPDTLRVVTTVEDLAAVARDLGGDKVSVEPLVRGTRDPHFVAPTPGLMTRVNEADLFIEMGFSLELWAERVLDGARNPRVRRGQPGHVYAGSGCPMLDIPPRLSRAEGEVHAEGNPHVNLDPLNLKIVAGNIAAGLQRVAPEDAAYFAERLAAFEKRIDEAFFGAELVRLLGAKTLERLHRQGKLISFLEGKSYKGTPLIERLGGWLGRMRPYAGTPVVTFHRTWTHLTTTFGLRIVGELEPKPGIAPSAGHLTDIERIMAAQRVPVVLYEVFYDEDIVEGVCERTDAKPLLLPGYVGGVPEATDVFSMFDAICDRFDAAMKK